MDEVTNTPGPGNAPGLGIDNVPEGFEPMPHKPIPKPVIVNGVPISHRVDGSDMDSIQNLINAETAPENQPAEPTPALKHQPRRAVQKQPVKEVAEEADSGKNEASAVEVPKEVKKTKLSGKDAFAAFKQAMSSSTIPVKLYSEDKEITLRELTVTDQKSLSKTALINNSRRDIIYNSQCAMINSCVKTKDFAIQNYTEFDRIVILLRLYEQNYFKNDVKYTCPVCHKENVYQIDFSKILNKIRAAWRPNKEYILTHADKTFRFTVGWPTVSTISEFYANYYKQYQNSNENTRNTIDQLSNVEYLVMFIKSVDLLLDNGSNEICLDLSDCSYAERTDLIDSLPQGLIFDDDDGVIAKVVEDFTDPLNKAFQYEKCQFCGAETEEGIGSIADFT